MNRLIHYSENPVLQAYSAEQDSHRPFKPKGLWLSVEGRNDWKEWCLSEGFGLDRLKCAAEVRLDPAANILRLSTEEAILDFTRRYGRAPLIDLPGLNDIDWSGAASDYQGIIIAPYQWRLRLDDRTFWYYGWDCASGCVWDAAAISSITQIEAPDIMLELASEDS
jgi:hypothetical protein